MNKVIGTTLSVTVIRENELSESWKFEIKEKNGQLWECKYLNRHFPDPIHENGMSIVPFDSISQNDKIVGLLILHINITAKEMPSALCNPKVFENKPVEITYDNTALESGILRNIGRDESV